MARSASDIQADLDLFYALRTKAATLGFAEYNINDGQGSQSVKRISLSEIRTTIRDLEAELNDADYAPTYLRLDR